MNSQCVGYLTALMAHDVTPESWNAMYLSIHLAVEAFELNAKIITMRRKARERWRNFNGDKLPEDRVSMCAFYHQRENEEWLANRLAFVMHKVCTCVCMYFIFNIVCCILIVS